MRTIDKVLILLTLTFCFQAYGADFKTLMAEYLEKNFQVQKSRLGVNLKKIDIELMDSTKSWYLNYLINHDDSELEPVASSMTKTLSNSLGVSKDFYWGGNFQFNNNLLKVTSKTLPVESWGFDQSLSYTQDLGANLFGRQDYLGRDLVKLDVSASIIKSNKEIENGLLNFFQSYNQARLNKVLKGLQNEALIRAEKRTNLIRRRVKDGLKQKVDLLQARMIEIQQKEAAKNIAMEFRTSLDSISNHLHRTVSEGEINITDVENIAIAFTLPKGTAENNKSVLFLKSQVEYLNSSIKKTNYGFFPTVKLSSVFKTNDYDAKSSNAIKKGRLGQDNRELVVGLNVSMPLGFAPQKAERSKYKTQLMITEAQTNLYVKNLHHNEKNLQKNIVIIKENIKLAIERRSLAHKVLKRYNYLYNMGRADLDQVIRAEEELISTQKALIRYLISQEKMYGSLALMYGKLQNYLTNR